MSSELREYSRQLRTTFIVGFVAAPLIVSLLLNPGKNGHNLPSFSSWELFLLGLCGLTSILSALICLFPNSYFHFAYKTQLPERPSHPYVVLPILLLLGLGIFGAYFAYKYLV